MKSNQSKLLLFIFLAFGITSNAQFSSTIPLNEDVVTGKLKNGMKYYILHNEWPKDRVSFYFAQNVGAILEEDNQNGLAHFLEHMAFNGTKNFEGKAIIDLLAKKGVSFGKDINAYTAHDQTVYNLSNVPSTDASLVDSCLLILHDWSGSLLLKENEIDAERGVITEEWRTRHTADFRLNSKTNKVFYKDSKYANRDVIGDIEIIKNFNYQELKDYYKKWYRPDLQAVIVVGDINAKEMEQKIIKLFAKIEMPKNASERYYVKIPDNKEMNYVLALDKEAPQVTISLSYKKAYDKVKNRETVRSSFIDFIAVNMLNRRYEEFLQSGMRSGLGFYASINEMSRLETSFNLTVVPKNGQEKIAFKDLMIEMERAVRYGFSQRELDRFKVNVLSYYENMLKNKDKINNNDLAEQLVSYYLTAAPFESLQKQYDEIKTLTQNITLTELNSAIKKLQTVDNSVLMVTGPDKNSESYPSQSDYLSIMDQVKKMSLEKNIETISDQQLIEDVLEGSAVVSQSDIKGINAKSYTLANGAQIILYPTKLTQDEVLFTAFSKGGKSLVSTENLASAEMCIDLIESSGLGKFKNTDLQDKLNGKIVSIVPYIDRQTEGFNGSSNQKDMQTLLELLYLYFEHPGFDSDSYARLIAEYKNELENRQNNSRKIFQDTITTLNAGNNKRLVLFNEEFLEGLNFEKSIKVYKERFKNASDFTFIFTGNLPENALELVQKYIGSISSNPDKKENFNNEGFTPADGMVKKEVVRNLGVERASVYIKFVNQAPYDYKNTFLLHFVSELLNKKYREIIREDQGGSYGVNLNANLERLPVNNYSLTVNFDCSPQMQSKLTQVIYEQIDLIKKGSADPAEIESIKQGLYKIRAEQVLTNSFWNNSLMLHYLTGEEIKNDKIYKETVSSITASDIRKYAIEFFKNPKIVEAVLKSKS